jgi:hypothetical protein
MLKSVEGVYRDGKIELTEFPGDVRNDTPVIVTFLETGRRTPGPIGDLCRGMEQSRHGALRQL